MVVNKQGSYLEDDGGAGGIRSASRGLTLQLRGGHFFCIRAGTCLKTRAQGPCGACKGSCCARGPTFWHTSLCVCQKLGSQAHQVSKRARRALFRVGNPNCASRFLILHFRLFPVSFLLSSLLFSIFRRHFFLAAHVLEREETVKQFSFYGIYLVFGKSYCIQLLRLSLIRLKRK